MLLLQLLLLVLGILCPSEIRLTYFTHILFLCLYLFATKKYKHLIFLTILSIALLINWGVETTPYEFIQNQSLSFSIANLEKHKHYSPVLVLNSVSNGNDDNRPFFSFGHTRVALMLNFKVALGQNKLNANASNNVSGVFSELDLINTRSVSYLKAEKKGTWLERKLYRQGLAGMLTLDVIHWTPELKRRLKELPLTKSETLLQKLDTVFFEVKTWPYSKALVLGDTRALNQKDYWLIKHLGLMHLFVVSGLHIGFVYLIVSVIANGLWFLFPAFIIRFIRHKALFSYILLIPVASSYALFTGWGESVQRALLMLFLWRTFHFYSVKLHPYKILLLSLYIILWLDFNALLSPGLWLSFSLVFLLLTYFQTREKQVSSTIKLQLVLSLCVTGLILGWQSTLSSISVLVNLIALPFVGGIWFPLVVLACLQALVFSSDTLMVLLDGIIQFFINLLEGIAFELPALSLQTSDGLLFKLLLYVICLLLVLYRHHLIAWLSLPLLLGLFLFSGLFNAPSLMGFNSSVFVIKNNHKDFILREKGKRNVLSSAWVNNRSELNLMLLTPYLNSQSVGDNELPSLMVWPLSEALISAMYMKSLSPDWLILKQSPDIKESNLLSAMGVNWIVLAEGERMSFEYWQKQWFIKHSNCLIFLISTQENNCMRVAELESVLNYSPKL